MNISGPIEELDFVQHHRKIPVKLDISRDPCEKCYLAEGSKYCMEHCPHEGKEQA